jgi:hypothetical protein
LDLDLAGLGRPNYALLDAEVFGGVQNGSVLGRKEGGRHWRREEIEQQRRTSRIYIACQLSNKTRSDSPPPSRISIPVTQLHVTRIANLAFWIGKVQRDLPNLAPGFSWHSGRP